MTHLLSQKNILVLSKFLLYGSECQSLQPHVTSIFHGSCFVWPCEVPYSSRLLMHYPASAICNSILELHCLSSRPLPWDGFEKSSLCREMGKCGAHLTCFLLSFLCISRMSFPSMICLNIHPKYRWVFKFKDKISKGILTQEKLYYNNFSSHNYFVYLIYAIILSL